MIGNDKQEFTLIVRGSIYAFMKEKYPDYEIDESTQKEDIKKITALLSKIEKYVHIPDKKLVVKENYLKLREYMTNSDFRESKLLESMKKKTQGLSVEEREYILNSIIYVMRDDLKISDTEKEIIVQISKFLEIDSDADTLLKNYKKTKFKRPVRKRVKGLFILLAFLLIAGGAFLYVKNANETRLFNEEKIVFDEVYFNRFVVYKNKFNTSMDHFKKQAVFYLSGSAEIGINPKNLQYDLISKAVTYTMPKDKKFLVDMKFTSEEMIDEIEPTPISKEEAQAMGAVIGVAGAFVGAKVGSSFGSLAPFPFGGTMGAIVGGVTGGAAVYSVTSKKLEGASLKKKISQKEKDIVVDEAEKLLKIVLSEDENLDKMYEKDFENYIKSKYASFGYEVKTVNYARGQ